MFVRVPNTSLYAANQDTLLLPGVATKHYDIIKLKLQQDTGVSLCFFWLKQLPNYPSFLFDIYN